MGGILCTIERVLTMAVGLPYFRMSVIAAGIKQADLVSWYLEQEQLSSLEALAEERRVVNQVCVTGCLSAQCILLLACAGCIVKFR
jgi:hypothetical protein